MAVELTAHPRQTGILLLHWPLFIWLNYWKFEHFVKGIVMVFLYMCVGQPTRLLLGAMSDQNSKKFAPILSQLIPFRLWYTEF